VLRIFNGYLKEMAPWSPRLLTLAFVLVLACFSFLNFKSVTQIDSMKGRDEDGPSKIHQEIYNRADMQLTENAKNISYMTIQNCIYCIRKTLARTSNRKA